MELKPYQQKVLNELDEYLGYVRTEGRYDKAFDKYWEDKLGPYNPLEGKGMEPYKNDVPRAPHVCIKVPTAGGKTFIASNAIEIIYRYYREEISKTVVWLVPSVTILEQTIGNLSDPTHPYRQRINTHFNSRVEVYRKDDLLNGTGFNATSVQEQLSILVLSFDSLRSKKKEDRKFYQENGQLASFSGMNEDLSHVLEGTDETALINVIRKLKPVVIVDEAHGAVSDLSVEMLRNLNPSFVLDLTATPRETSNIISFVNAMELKKENMVKLPVIVYNHKDRNGVIESAINLQRKLEKAAKEEELNGGRYIRPIVLFQAQSKTAEDNTTFEKIKQILLALKIPEAEIRIKTADINEIKDVDLMSPECPVRYIITVNALKEGWDCPFAYILASLADKSSAIDVEQILGRVLRQPYVKQHKFDLLNCSFVLTASAKFMDTLENIVRGLNKAGFSKHDYKIAADETASTETKQGTSPAIQLTTGTEAPLEDIGEEVKPEQISVAIDESTPATEATRAIEEQATQANREMIDMLEKRGNDVLLTVAVEIQNKVKTYAMKELFAEKAKAIQLPMFFMKVPAGGFLLDDEYVPFDKDSLLRDFKLSQQDSTIDFDSAEANLYKVDLEKTKGDDSTPTFSQLEDSVKKPLIDYLLSQPKEIQVKQLAGKFVRLVGDQRPIAYKELVLYIKRIVDSFSAEQMTDAIHRELSYSDKIKEKIRKLAQIHTEERFNRNLDTDQIITREVFTLINRIQPARLGASIAKSLYEAEAEMNDFEERVINAIANCSNVEFWHRNMERRGFCINGFINHYPDFLVQMKSGKILVIETKGDHLDGEDSKAKIRLGQKWAGKAGNNYKYYMVFDQKKVDGAKTIDEMINLIKEL